MYMSESFLETARKNLKQQWRSPSHKTVASKILLFNSAVFTMDRLMEGVRKINAIPFDQIEKVTLDDLAKLEVPGILGR